MDIGNTNPLATEEQRLSSMVKKVNQLEKDLNDSNVLIERLKVLIKKSHCECFPPTQKAEMEPNWRDVVANDYRREKEEEEK